jgi:hypothetical protein
MSRYQIPSKTEDYEVVVGWDDPLETYFAQAIRPENGEILLWLGADPNDKVLSVDELETKLKTHGYLDKLPANIYKNLLDDFDQRKEPSGIAKMIRKFIEKDYQEERNYKC